MNADAQFKDFVARQQRASAADDSLDWDRERDEWLGHLDRLYRRIANDLDAFVQRGEITLHESTIELNEEHIGAYAARRLAIVIGAREIVLTPVGTLLIGSKGRVDVDGSAGTSRLVLVDKDVTDFRSIFRVTVRIDRADAPPSPPEPAQSPKAVEWAWKIASRPPAMQFIDLNKETLFELLMDVSGG